MLIMCLVLGFCFGAIAALATLLSGAGFLAVFGAYVLGGFAGIVLSILWAAVPQRANAEKHSVTQQG